MPAGWPRQPGFPRCTISEAETCCGPRQRTGLCLAVMAEYEQRDGPTRIITIASQALGLTNAVHAVVPLVSDGPKTALRAAPIGTGAPVGVAASAAVIGAASIVADAPSARQIEYDMIVARRRSLDEKA